MTRNRLIFPILLIILTSCFSSKVYRILTAGEAQAESFYVTIPFEYRAGLPFVEVTVNGEKGLFLFDTGAPNVISEDFAEKLGVKTLAEAKVNDSGGNSTKGNANVKLDDVEIGGVHFYDTGAIVQNLKGSDIFNCLNFDGLIGANLMRLAFWKLDYRNQEISMASDLSQFGDMTGYTKLPFKPKFTGTPVVSIELNDQTISDLTFDTGSNGHTSFPVSSLKKFSSELESIYSVGATSYGVGGRAQSDTTFYIVMDSIRFGEIGMKNKIVEFEEHANNIGSDFLRYFDFIMDWEAKVIYLKKHSEYEYEHIESIGFGVNLEGGKVLVGYIYEGSASEESLQMGDEILRIGENDFENADPNLICELLKERKLVWEDSDRVELLIRRNGEKISLSLDKKKLL